VRRQFAVAALAVTVLLTGTITGAAHAAVAADDVFFPDGQEPAVTAPPAGDSPAEPEAAPSSDRERALALARGSRQAADLVGYLPSLYQGKWYQPKYEDVRRCIMSRESNHNYRASNGTYHGAYQMSAALARGATWMMQKEVRKEMGEEGVAIVKALRKLTPNKWNRYWQDRAFWTIWRDGAGAGHWRGGAHSC
jgi:hypothetical protein